MDRKNGVRVLNEVTRNHGYESPEHGVLSLVWKGAWVSTGRDPRRVQAMVGRTRQGCYVPGLSADVGKGQASVSWGSPEATEGEARAMSQCAAAIWLKGREIVRGRERGVEDVLDQARAAMEAPAAERALILAPGAPRSQREEVRMMKALHEEHEATMRHADGPGWDR